MLGKPGNTKYFLFYRAFTFFTYCSSVFSHQERLPGTVCGVFILKLALMAIAEKATGKEIFLSRRSLANS